ncbi:MAG: FAD-binding oxidoreductase [Deltaproteobacteria bacterium]|nr:MAG: FAD-binding oxidoreductase [Deltaproteobacteria bacterium]
MNLSLPDRANVVIVGGGIIGVSIAYYLAKKRVSDVLLLEQGVMGEGSTAKCVGGIRTQFSTEINIQFSQLSRRVFEGFEAEFGVDPEFHKIGYLFLAADHRQQKIIQDNACLMEGLDLEMELLDPEEIQRRWPFLRVDDVLTGSYTAYDGYLGPYEVLTGFISGARRLGAIFHEGIEVIGIDVERGKIQGVRTSTGERVKTQVVVNASGPYAAKVAELAGLDLPVCPLRRQVFFTDPFEDLPPAFPLVIDLKHGWYMRREGKGLILAGPQDSKSSFSEQVDFAGKEWAATRSVHRVPILKHARIARGWAGLYEISPDNHAIIGSFPEREGFICANGFSGHGFMHSPAAGILVAELITEGTARSLDIHPLRPQRFQQGDLIREPMTAFHD